MPNLPAHMELAHQVAQRLNHRFLDDYLGYFLLGSTSPDIRVITRKTREEYHFVTLDFEAIGEGVEGMFRRNPSLRVPAALDYQSQAFVAGYITHLIADETWIVTMFRRFFGNPEVFEDDVYGKVMDRVMQLELDRLAWEAVESNQHQLRAATSEVDIGFIPSETLFDWRDWILGFLDRGFTWDRLRFMARRIAQGEEVHPAYGVVDEFVQDVSGGLDQLFEIVSRRDLADYREGTVESLVHLVGDYLS